MCWMFWMNKCSSLRHELQHALTFGCVWGWVPGRFERKEQSHSIQKNQHQWSWTCRTGKTVWRLLSQILNGFGLHIPTLTCSLGCKCNKRRFTECLGMWSTHSRIIRSGQCRKHCSSDNGAQSSEAYKAWDFELIFYDAFPPYRVDDPGVHNWSCDARHVLRVAFSTTFCNFSKAKQK